MVALYQSHLANVVGSESRYSNRDLFSAPLPPPWPPVPPPPQAVTYDPTTSLTSAPNDRSSASPTHSTLCRVPPDEASSGDPQILDSSCHLLQSLLRFSLLSGKKYGFTDKNMAWNANQNGYGVPDWNPYAANGMWNMMSMFPGLLTGAGMGHPGYMYPSGCYQGSTPTHAAALPHPSAALQPSPSLNHSAALQRHLVPTAESSPPLSPGTLPPSLSPPTADPYAPVTPPHSPTSAALDPRFPYPPVAPQAGHRPVPPQPFVSLPAIGSLPPPREPVSTSSLGATVVDVPTRDENGRKLPRWMIKRAMCTLCNKRFESRHKLQLHLYSHTGERPHECEICGMRFARKFCYKRHLKTHSASRPFVCTRCGRGFREKYDMETHMMTEVCLKQARADQGPEPPLPVERLHRTLSSQIEAARPMEAIHPLVDPTSGQTLIQ